MKKSILVLAVSVLVLLAGCSPAQKSSAPTTPTTPTTPSFTVPGVPTPPSAPVEVQQDREGLFGGGAGRVPQPAPAPAPAPEFGFPSSATAPAGQVTTDRLIVRTANMAMVVDDIAVAIEQISGMTDALQGTVISSNIFGDNNRLFGSISIRVPSERFDDAMRGLRAQAVEVTSETTNARDVTEEYTDLNAKLRNLEAAEQQLLKILEKAENVKDILDVQRELTNTRGQIEQTKGRIQFLERTSSTSLIDISLQQSKLNLDFNASRTVIKEGEAAFFSAGISGGFPPYSYQWDLGDETTTTEAAFNYAYRNDGKYTVSLTVTDDHGNTISKSRTDYVTVITGWEAGNTVRSAYNGLVGFGRGLTSVVIWLGIFAPVWLAILAIAYGISRYVRRRKKPGNP